MLPGHLRRNLAPPATRKIVRNPCRNTLHLRALGRTFLYPGCLGSRVLSEPSDAEIGSILQLVRPETNAFYSRPGSTWATFRAPRDGHFAKTSPQPSSGISEVSLEENPHRVLLRVPDSRGFETSSLSSRNCLGNTTPEIRVGWLSSKIADSEAFRENNMYPKGVRTRGLLTTVRQGSLFRAHFTGLPRGDIPPRLSPEPGLFCPQCDTRPWFAARRPVEWLEIPLGLPSKDARS